MGDRGNIVITDGTGNGATLYLYTHWTGSDLPAIVAKALEVGKPRWGDEPYLNRVLFQTLIGDDTGITGYGISTMQGDGGTEVSINHANKSVDFDGTAYPFESFVKAFKKP